MHISDIAGNIKLKKRIDDYNNFLSNKSRLI